MAMKRTQLEKLRAVTILDRIRHSMSPGRFGHQSSQFMNRKERREAEKAAGLVPFAVKLHASIVDRVRQLASQRSGDINGVVSELIEAGLVKYPDIVAAKVEAAPNAESTIPAAPLSLAHKLVAVALGKPGATVVEKPVVKPARHAGPKPEKKVKPPVAKPAKPKVEARGKAKTSQKKPIAVPAKKAVTAKGAAKKASSPAPKKSASLAKSPVRKKPAVKPAPKKAIAKAPSKAVRKAPSKSAGKSASKPASKPASKSAGKAKRK